MENQVYELSICLSDLPKPKMRTGRNGKIYIELSVAERQSPDQWGRTLKAWVTQKKADREAGEAKIYVGGGKIITFASSRQKPPTDAEINDIIPQTNDNEKDDLPF